MLQPVMPITGISHSTFSKIDSPCGGGQTAAASSPYNNERVTSGEQNVLATCEV